MFTKKRIVDDKKSCTGLMNVYGGKKIVDDKNLCTGPMKVYEGEELKICVRDCRK